MKKFVIDAGFEIVQIMEHHVLYYVYDMKKKFFIDRFGRLLPQGQGFFTFEEAVITLRYFLKIVESEKMGGVQ